MDTHESIVKQWNTQVERSDREPQPVMQSLYLDLVNDPNIKPEPIHLGFRSGIPYLLNHLKELEEAGVNHVALNLRFNQANVTETLHQIQQHILSHFNN